MNSCRQMRFAVLFTLLLFLLISTSASAQGPADPAVATPATTADATAGPDAPAPAAPLPDAPSAAGSSDGSWRVKMSIYGWFPGIHGTVGALGHNVGVHESFSDVFHVLKGVIPIAVDFQKGRFVMPLDFFWVKLGDDKAIPLNDFGQTSVNLHITESIFTPKIGYRVLNADRFKIDALGGIRYWYVSQNLSLEPSGLNQTFSNNWVDGLGGMRFIVPLGEKAAIMVAGDAGAGGASLDYQAVGLFTYDFTRKLGLGLGWRYLDVDYRHGRDAFIYDVAQSGALAGLYFNFGGKPPVPPMASCSTSPTEVLAGDPVSATISTQNFNPKHTVSYKWTSTGGKISGAATTGSVDTTGLAPGSYTVTGTATDQKEKKNNSTSCSATFAVRQPPQHPPVASCSASPSTVKAGDPATVSVNASSPDGASLSYAYATTAGSISGSGPSATLDTANASPGNSITTTATVTDSRGLTASCTAMVNVLAPPTVVQQVSEIGECKFMNPKKPWRVDNECKAVLDDVALRIQREPNGKLVVVGYAEEEEKVKYEQLGAQRSVNVKYYLTEGEGAQKIDPAMIEPRVGAKSDKSAKFYLVPAGATFTQEETVKVDETMVKGQSRNAPASEEGKESKHAAPEPVGFRRRAQSLRLYEPPLSIFRHVCRLPLYRYIAVARVGQVARKARRARPGGRSRVRRGGSCRLWSARAADCFHFFGRCRSLQYTAQLNRRRS